MGLVYKVSVEKGLKKQYPKEQKLIVDALIDPGKEASSQDLDPLSVVEVDRILLKLDALAPDSVSENIARLVAMAAEVVIDAVRMVKTQNHQPFMGAMGTGNMLDVRWMRSKDIGNPVMRGGAAAGALGIYAQAPLAALTFTWLRTFVENTAQNIIPLQTNGQFSAFVHLGFIDTIDGISKMSDVTYTSGGVATPPQNIGGTKKRFVGAAQDVAVMPLERPIIVPPFRNQLFSVLPTSAGDSRLEMLTLFVGQVQDFITNL
ncbi:MAG: hypothetical protein V1767_00910 [Chloroflexota bacterium]